MLLLFILLYTFYLCLFINMIYLRVLLNYVCRYIPYFRKTQHSEHTSHAKLQPIIGKINIGPQN